MHQNTHAQDRFDQLSARPDSTSIKAEHTDNTEHSARGGLSNLNNEEWKVPRLDQESPTSFGCDVEVSLRRDIQVIRLSANQELELNLPYSVFDNDGTLMHGTGDRVHDGFQARFARGLSIQLVSLQRVYPEINLLSDDQIAAFRERGSIFCPNSWGVYRDRTGVSEDTVRADIATIAYDRFALHRLEGSPTGFSLANMIEHYGRHVDAALVDYRSELMMEVTKDSGLVNYIIDLRRKGGRAAVCSASSPDFVIPALEALDMKHLFDDFVTKAVKKVPSYSTGHGTQYRRESILDALDQIGKDPSRTVMFGDGMADAGSALMAGLPIIVLRASKPLSPVPFGQLGCEEIYASAVGELCNLAKQIESLDLPIDPREPHPGPQRVFLVESSHQIKCSAGAFGEQDPYRIVTLPAMAAAPGTREWVEWSYD